MIQTATWGGAEQSHPPRPPPLNAETGDAALSSPRGSGERQLKVAASASKPRTDGSLALAATSEKTAVSSLHPRAVARHRAAVVTEFTRRPEDAAGVAFKVAASASSR